MIRIAVLKCEQISLFTSPGEQTSGVTIPGVLHQAGHILLAQGVQQLRHHRADVPRGGVGHQGDQATLQAV